MRRSGRRSIWPASGFVGLLKYLPADTEMTIVSELENVGGYIGDFVQKIAASAGSRVVRTLPEVFVNTIIVFLSSYLFLADHDKLVETVRKVMPEPVIKYGRMMKNDIRTLIGGYFLAQFKIMFVVAVVLVDRNVIPQGSIWNFSWNRDRDSGFSADVRHRNGIDSLGSGETLYREYGYALSLVILYVLTQGIRQVIQRRSSVTAWTSAACNTILPLSWFQVPRYCGNDHRCTGRHPLYPVLRIWGI